MLVRSGVAVLLLACLSACGSSGGKGVAQRGSYKIGAPYKIDGVTYTPQEEFNHVETGVASWYGPGLAGRKTTSGEIFNPRALTAASRALPIGSVVKVTNPQNGKSVSVRINDRGPFVPGRSLDLSRRAAEKLGIIHMGVASVKVTKPSSQADISSDY